MSNCLCVDCGKVHKHGTECVQKEDELWCWCNVPEHKTQEHIDSGEYNTDPLRHLPDNVKERLDFKKRLKALENKS